MSRSDLQPIKKFLGRFILLTVCLILLDAGIGAGLKWLFKHQKSGLFFRSNYAINATQDDILVFGSSRANHHYNSHVFEQKSGYTFYNCGKDGESLIYSVAVLSAVIERYTPKIVIIDILPDEFTTSDVGKLASLLPYYDNKSIQPFLKYNGKYQDIKLLSKIYPYNSLLTTLIVGVMDYNEARSLDHKGYVRLEGRMLQKEVAVFSEAGPTNFEKVKILDNILKVLEQKKIKSKVIISPLYFKYNNGPTDRICKKITAKYQYAEFLNFANSKQFRDNYLFKDTYHLNDYGASYYSNRLVEYLFNDSPIKVADQDNQYSIQTRLSRTSKSLYK